MQEGARERLSMGQVSRGQSSTTEQFKQILPLRLRARFLRDRAFRVRGCAIPASRNVTLSFALMDHEQMNVRKLRAAVGHATRGRSA